MVALYKDLFVTFFIDKSNETLYQISADGDNRVLKKENLQWEKYLGQGEENVCQLTRRNAERIEDNWIEDHEEQGC